MKEKLSLVISSSAVSNQRRRRLLLNCTRMWTFWNCFTSAHLIVHFFPTNFESVSCKNVISANVQVSPSRTVVQNFGIQKIGDRTSSRPRWVIWVLSETGPYWSVFLLGEQTCRCITVIMTSSTVVNYSELTTLLKMRICINSFLNNCEIGMMNARMKKSWQCLEK